MRSPALSLENFGDGRRPDPDRARALAEAAAAARGEGHAAGYAEGFADGMAQADAEERAALSAVREGLRDLELAQAGAREAALAALRPVVVAILATAAPRAAAEGLAEAVGQAVAARLAAAPADRVAVRCAPDRAEALAARLGDVAEVRPDPALGPADARLEWTAGGVWFDARGALAAAQAALDATFGVAVTGEDRRDAG